MTFLNTVLLFFVFCCLGVNALCPGQNMPLNPEDPGKTGPWPVSSKKLDSPLTKRKLTVEIYFPATPGSEQGAKKYTYSPNDHLPADQAAKVPVCVGPPPVKPTCCQPTQYMDKMWQGLPLDTTHGPYPVIVFIHGTAAYREYFSHIVEHWCSRGFVVVSADYPGITLKDEILKLELKPTPKTDQVGDTELLIKEFISLKNPELSWLKGHINMTLLGITGHSAGGSATGHLSSSYGKVLIPMAGGGTNKRFTKYSSLVIGGENDTIVGGDQIAGYRSSPTPKRHLGVANAGHETYCDLCWMAPKQGGACGIGRSCGVLGSDIFEHLADQGCQFARNDPHAKNMLNPEDAWSLVRYATAGVFEETLLCDNRMTAQLAALPTHFNSTMLGKWTENLK